MLPEKVKVIIDLALGDGCIHFNSPGSKNPAFTIGHGMKQAVYAQHKANLLREYGFDVRENVYVATTGKNKGKSFYRVYLPASPEIHTAYKWVYNKGRKSLDKALFRNIDVRTLAYWFMDDGCAKKTNRIKRGNINYVYAKPKTNAYKFSTNCFSEAECFLFSRWLEESFGIHSTVTTTSRGPLVMIYQIESKDIFRSLIEPYIIESMRYKIEAPHSFKDIPFTIVAAETTEREDVLN